MEQLLEKQGDGEAGVNSEEGWHGAGRPALALCLSPFFPRASDFFRVPLSACPILDYGLFARPSVLPPCTFPLALDASDPTCSVCISILVNSIRPPPPPPPPFLTPVALRAASPSSSALH
jgi:hypothetical protein